jgi:hypothetical protein
MKVADFFRAVRRQHKEKEKMVTSYEQVDDWKQYYFWGLSDKAPSELSFSVEQMQALLGMVKGECAVASLAALDPKHLINHKGTTTWILLVVFALMNHREELAAVANGTAGLFLSANIVHDAYGSHVNWPERLLQAYSVDFGDRRPLVIPFVRHRDASAPAQLTQSLRSPDGAIEIMGVAEFSEQQPEALLALFHEFYSQHRKDFEPRPSPKNGFLSKLFSR